MADLINRPPSIFEDEYGRQFAFVHVDNGHTRLVVHFSAFFGDWGDTPKYREAFGGYFHRLKMLGEEDSVDWLFICDSHGADGNGTYYLGERGDYFVERAVQNIFTMVGIGVRYKADQVLMFGSSMGATAALRFGIDLRCRGIVAIAPHVDLDLCAKFQGRERHVAFALVDGDTQRVANYPITRAIRFAVEGSSVRLPRLFVQTCIDDVGVYRQQVVPLVRSWRRNGDVWIDRRLFGGHTSEYATKALLLDVVNVFFDDSRPKLFGYRLRSVYRPRGFCAEGVLFFRRMLGHMKLRVLRALRV